MTGQQPHIRIIGTRGIPAEHGGFETFAQECALYLQERGWCVTVYCQETGTGSITEDSWNGIRLVKIPVNRSGPLSTIVFDWKTISHTCREPGLVLCLGYNTAVFNLRLRLKGLKTITNMDGIEWKRGKWGTLAKLWFYLNERAGIHLSDHLVADNPGIARHLQRRGASSSLTTIAYGAPYLEDISAQPLADFNLEPGKYLLLIARPEPENSILEIVQAFGDSERNCKLAILGDYSPDHPYQKKVLDEAGDQVVFCGAIYDQKIVAALRYHCLFYVHGHTVGGTNPSLVEAMGAGNAVLAHDNIFNKWVTGEKAARFFTDRDECRKQMDSLISSPAIIVEMKQGSTERFLKEFTWDNILQQYENCFRQYLNEDDYSRT